MSVTGGEQVCPRPGDDFDYETVKNGERKRKARQARRLLHKYAGRKITFEKN
jgi:hypothetical protein